MRPIPVHALCLLRRQSRALSSKAPPKETVAAIIKVTATEAAVIFSTTFQIPFQCAAQRTHCRRLQTADLLDNSGNVDLRVFGSSPCAKPILDRRHRSMRADAVHSCCGDCGVEQLQGGGLRPLGTLTCGSTGGVEHSVTLVVAR